MSSSTSPVSASRTPSPISTGRCSAPCGSCGGRCDDDRARDRPGARWGCRFGQAGGCAGTGSFAHGPQPQRSDHGLGLHRPQFRWRRLARLQRIRALPPGLAAFRPKAPIVKLTPEQAFFKAAPIDPNAPHPYFLNRGVDTTRFSNLDQVVRIAPRYRRKETDAWGPALVFAITDNEGRIVGRQYKPLNADRSAKDGVEPKAKNGAGDKVKGHAIRLGPA